MSQVFPRFRNKTFLKIPAKVLDFFQCDKTFMGAISQPLRARNRGVRGRFVD
jgi:hypothetical protein